MMQSKMVRLGDYIEQRNERNSDLRYDASLIEGVNNLGVFCKSKANTDDINLKPYKAVYRGDFAYNPSRLNIGSLALREGEMCIVSHLYVVFHLNELGKKHFLPEYLYIYFNRDEFRRLVTVLNYGSQRPEFNFYEFSDLHIPLPSIEKQREIVAVWKSLRRLKEENEKIAEPLMAMCRSKIQELKNTMPLATLGDYIEHNEERNEGKYDISSLRGISIEKKFIESKANMENVSLAPYLIVSPTDISFVTITSRNGDKISLAINDSKETYIVSSSYEAFHVKDSSILNSFYLFLLLTRTEFDRYARFNSWGSAREAFSWEEMKRVKIPVPPIKVQQAIVDFYECAQRAKTIAAEADRQLKTICPALIQYVKHN